jgi:hypothetical protein
MWISYYYIKEGLKTQSPSVVVLDLNGMLYGNSGEQPEATDDVSYQNSFSIDPGWNFLEMIQTVATCGIDLRDPIDFLPLVRYHSRWKNLDENAFTYNAHNDHSYLKGYGFQTLVTPNAQPVYTATEEREAPYETALTYLDKIVELSQKENFQLVFVLAPYAYQENELAIFNWLQDYADAHQIPFLNYCTSESERIQLDWATDFCDERHVNYVGALKLTRDLGELLTQMNVTLRTPEQLPNAQQLDVDAAKMQRTIDLWEAIQGTSADFLQWVQQSGGTLGVCVGGDGTAVPDEVLTLLTDMGFTDVTQVRQSGVSYAALLENGAVTQQYSETGDAVECQSARSTFLVSSKGSVTFGAQMLYNDESYTEAASGLVLYYYDNVLERPLYRVDINADGTFDYTEFTAKSA